MTRSIADIRKAIDTVDREIHDLLVERAKLAVEIGAGKKAAGQQMILSDREAVKIRSLLARHKGAMPRAALVGVWRELIGAAAVLQTGMKVVVAVPEENAQEYWGMTRSYFGRAVPLQGVANPLVAISALREGEADFAVLSWPPDEVENPWWCHLTAADPARTVRVVVRLPYLETGETIGHPEYRAVVVARSAFNDSGEDNSFIFLDLDQAVSRARVVDKARDLGFKPISVVSRKTKPTQKRSQHFMEVETYVPETDDRLPRLLEKLESPDGTCLALGGYPVLPPLVEKEKDGRDKKITAGPGQEPSA